MSKTVKEAGHKAVISYEKSKGRNAVPHEKDGYDIISSSKTETRHIEVKATTKEGFQWRWLTHNEFNAACTDPNFYLYLVKNAKTLNPSIREMRRDELMQLYKGTTVLHVFAFPKNLVAKISEIEECC